MPHDVGVAPLKLTALTLRGVGSYLRGARLEICPITVLCGTNGSGKSTWLWMLNMLRQSLDRGMLPFAFDVDDSDIQNLEYMNACVYADYDDNTPADAGEEDRFGALGTIGLEFVAATDLELPAVPLDSDRPPLEGGDLPRSLVWTGKIVAGTRFRLRIAHPTHWTSDQSVKSLRDVIELRIEDEQLVRLDKRRTVRERLDGKDRQLFTRYRLSCSRQLLDGHAGPAIVDCGEVEPDRKGGWRFSATDAAESVPLAGLFTDHVIARVQQLLRIVLSGYFYISAIRRIHEADHLTYPEPAEGTKGLVARRYVGPNGEATYALERAFAYNLMRERVPPFTGFIPQSFKARGEFDPASIHMRLTEAGTEPPASPRRRIWELATEDARRIASTPLIPQWDSAYTPDQMGHAVAGVLNSVLHRRDLYSAEAWPDL